LDEKIDRGELAELRGLVKILPKADEMNKMKIHLFKRIEEFKSEMDKFSIGFEQQNEIIRRYDEVLIEKCSKTALMEVEDKLE
jgi:hypothetical protein